MSSVVAPPPPPADTPPHASPIREDTVQSAVRFLQDSSVASASLARKISFLESKSLTSAEIDEAIRRANGSQVVSGPAVQSLDQQQQQQHQQHYHGFQPQLLPPLPPPPPQHYRWKDYTLATVGTVGAGYALMQLFKHVIQPMIQFPTGEQVEADKQEIMKQLEHNTEAVDAIEEEFRTISLATHKHTSKLNQAIVNLTDALAQLKEFQARQDTEMKKLREEMDEIKRTIAGNPPNTSTTSAVAEMASHQYIGEPPKSETSASARSFADFASSKLSEANIQVNSASSSGFPAIATPTAPSTSGGVASPPVKSYSVAAPMAPASLANMPRTQPAVASSTSSHDSVPSASPSPSTAADEHDHNATTQLSSHPGPFVSESSASSTTSTYVAKQKKIPAWQLEDNEDSDEGGDSAELSRGLKEKEVNTEGGEQDELNRTESNTDVASHNSYST